MKNPNPTGKEEIAKSPNPTLHSGGGGAHYDCLRNDSLLASLRIRVEVGEPKNKNKNPIAEKAVQELEDELLRQDPERTSVSAAVIKYGT